MTMIEPGGRRSRRAISDLWAARAAARHAGPAEGASAFSFADKVALGERVSSHDEAGAARWTEETLEAGSRRHKQTEGR